MNSTNVGTATEAVILQRLTRKGLTVLLPFGGGVAYDLAYDDEGKLVRVQCKTGRYRNGCVIFNTATKTRAGVEVGYLGKADYFGVWCVEIDKAFLVPVELVAKGKASLRVEASRNNQQSRVLLASSYEI